MKACTIILLLIISGCSKSPLYMNEATITGFDTRMGPCTGGIYILIEGHPNPNNIDLQFDIDSLPPSFKIDNSTHFPIKVSINWFQETKCGGNYINITTIRRNN